MDFYTNTQVVKLTERMQMLEDAHVAQTAELKDVGEKLLECSTYLIKTLQILERVVPILPTEDIHRQEQDFSLTDAIIALEHIRKV